MESHLHRPRYDEEHRGPSRAGNRRPDDRDGVPHATMEVLTDPAVNAASILLETPAGGHDVLLNDDVVVTLDDGRLTAIELLDLRSWGDPFDDDAARRAIAWVRDELARRG